MRMMSASFTQRFGKTGLGVAIFWAVMAGIYLGIGLCQIIKYAKSGDGVGEVLGIANSGLALSQIMLGTQTIRAVVARLISESRISL